MQEYIAVRAQFDSVKKNMTVNQQTGDTSKQEIAQLQNKMELIKKTQEIELRHQKEVSTKLCNELLEKKLNECRFAYEEELEYIA